MKTPRPPRTWKRGGSTGPRRPAHGGRRGTSRLTSSVGLVLLVLLGIEALTALALSSYLPEHIFLGLLLIRPSP